MAIAVDMGRKATKTNKKPGSSLFVKVLVVCVCVCVCVCVGGGGGSSIKRVQNVWLEQLIYC